MTISSWIGSVAIAAFLCLPTVAAQPRDKGEVAFRAAMEKETVEGDLKGAIEQYNKLAQGKDRAVSAKALVRMGQCYDKLGSAESRKAYERVVREFGDQKEAAAQARELLAAKGGASETGAVARTVGGHQRAWSFGPAISRDGRYIAATSWDTGSIRIVDLATGNPAGPDIRISAEGKVYNALIAPDGRSVAFRRQESPELNGLYVVGADGSEPRRVAGGKGAWARPYAWSPDGKQVLTYLSSEEKGKHLALVSVADGSSRVISSKPSADGRISPDGRLIALVREKPSSKWQEYGELFLLNIETGQESVALAAGIKEPSWTFDGKRLLLVSDRNGQPDLWSIRIENGMVAGPMELVQNNVEGLMGTAPNGECYYYSQVHVTDHYLADLDPSTGLLRSQPRQITREGDNYGASWSPDGEYLAGYRWRRVSGSGKEILAIHSAKTGEARELELKEPLSYGDGAAWYPFPLWFPDSRTILVHNPFDGKLHRLDVQTSQFQTLPKAANVPLYRDGGGTPQLVLLSPDGRSVYYQKRDSAAGETVFLLRALEGGPEKELTRIKASAVRGFSVSPDGSRLAIAASGQTGWTLWTASTNGGAPQELSAMRPAQLHHPKWSRDGRHVFVCLDDTIQVFPAGGGEPKRLELPFPRKGGTLDIRPDGREIVFAYGQWNNQLWALKNLFGEVKPAR